ncbi:hypothetical protein BC827DRAFT_1173848 [Russula dissimulans]|nr:hypothetical protein BC827DRAFT_1173848 [Russula dissimulans]
MVETRNHTEQFNPTWPSLYDPFLEFHNLEHRPPIQPGGHYLTHAGDVFRFTFFWTLIFNSLFFFVTGGIACFNVIYPAQRHNNGFISASFTRDPAPQPAPPSNSMIPLTPLTSVQSPEPLLPGQSGTVDDGEPRAPQPRKHVRRSRATYALFTLLAFLVTALVASFVESAVVGYVLWAVFQAGGFNLSTWLPPVWALITTSSVVLGAFPSVIDRI